MLYLISSLGAEHRVFQNLHLPEHQHIYWEYPKGLHLSAYAQQLCKQIKNKKEIVLLGVSFGGIVAIGNV